MWFSVILTSLDEGEMERDLLLLMQCFLEVWNIVSTYPCWVLVHCYGCSVADLNQIYCDVYLLACKLQPL